MRRGKKIAAALTAVLALGMFSGCGQIDADAVAVTVAEGEDTVTLGYANFVAKYTQAVYETTYGSSLGEDMWNQDLYGNGNTFEEDVKNDVMDSLQEQYLLVNHASDYGVELTEEDTAAIETAAEQFMSDNTQEALDQMGATQEYVEQMLTWQTLSGLVSEAIRQQAQPTATEEDARMRTFTYVFFNTASVTDDSGESRAMTDDEKEEQRELAQMITDPTNFSLGASSIGGTMDTYSYHPGDEEETMAPEVIEAADALGEGQVSQVIEVEDQGFYVIRLDSDYDQEASAEELSSLQEQQRDEYLQTTLDGWKEETSWEVNDGQWAKVAFDVPFTAAGSEE